MKTSGEEVAARAVSGVLAGLLATTVLHPIDLVQKRIQVQDRKAVGPAARYSGMGDALLKTARQNGLASLYEGLSLSYLSTLVKNAVFFSSYESLKCVISCSLLLPLTSLSPDGWPAKTCLRPSNWLPAFSLEWPPQFSFSPSRPSPPSKMSIRTAVPAFRLWMPFVPLSASGVLLAFSSVSLQA